MKIESLGLSEFLVTFFCILRLNDDDVVFLDFVIGYAVLSV